MWKLKTLVAISLASGLASISCNPSDSGPSNSGGTAGVSSVGSGAGASGGGGGTTQSGAVGMGVPKDIAFEAMYPAICDSCLKTLVADC